MRVENEWFEPEKLTVLYFVYEAIVAALLVATVGLLVVGAFEDAPLWVLLGLGIPTVAVFAVWTWWIPAFYRSTQYRLTDDEIEYHRGVFFRQKTTVPYDRITNVGTSQGPIERLVGAGSVGVHTAGYGGQAGAELSISAVTDFDEIKAQILEKVHGRTPVATEGADDRTATEDTDDRTAVESANDHAATLETAAVDGDVLVELRRIREFLEQRST